MFVWDLLRRELKPRARLARIGDQRRFLRDLRAYAAMPGAEPIRREDLLPCLGEWNDASPFDPHYFHLGIWAFRRIVEAKPAFHVDVGSQVNFVGLLTCATRVQFIDLRPLAAVVPNLESIRGSVLEIPHPDRSLSSLSCLHVAEHVGLGRYGDPLDPAGTRSAARELSRVLAPGGSLYFALPVGRPRLCFNAHRVHSVAQVRSIFPGLALEELSGVDDTGRFVENADAHAFDDCAYACGFFHFRRTVETAVESSTR